MPTCEPITTVLAVFVRLLTRLLLQPRWEGRQRPAHAEALNCISIVRHHAITAGQSASTTRHRSDIAMIAAAAVIGGIWDSPACRTASCPASLDFGCSGCFYCPTNGSPHPVRTHQSWTNRLFVPCAPAVYWLLRLQASQDSAACGMVTVVASGPQTQALNMHNQPWTIESSVSCALAMCWLLRLQASQHSAACGADSGWASRDCGCSRCCRGPAGGAVCADRQHRHSGAGAAARRRPWRPATNCSPAMAFPG